MGLPIHVSGNGYIPAQEVENVTGPNGVGRVPDLIRNVMCLARERERRNNRYGRILPRERVRDWSSALEDRRSAVIGLPTGATAVVPIFMLTDIKKQPLPRLLFGVSVEFLPFDGHAH